MFLLEHINASGPYNLFPGCEKSFFVVGVSLQKENYVNIILLLAMVFL